MRQFVKKHPRKTLFLVIFLVILVEFILAEGFLKVFCPFSIATIGHVHSRNAEIYGWGYNPHELIKIRDPDTGQVYVGPSNNHGWRDRDRAYENRTGAYRILVLGDSNTFGGIVPAEKVYTRVLEDRLRSGGLDVEVINIAYGRWGTDQQLEALMREGLLYEPDLIIVQFCTNDLQDNAYFFRSAEAYRGWKPFYYALDTNDHLVRHENPHFMNRDRGRTWKERFYEIISMSEIAKRLHFVFLRYRFREDPEPEYSVTGNQLEMLRLALHNTKVADASMPVSKGLDKDDADGADEFLNILSSKMGERVKTADLDQLMDACGLSHERDKVLRILEKRVFHRYWSGEDYQPKEQDMDAFEWRLFFSIMDEIHSIAKKAGADLAVISDNEPGQYRWEVDWHRMSDDPVSRRNYLQPTEILRDFAGNRGIGFIENVVPHKRARNDPHPNCEGNEAMAENIYRYLMANHPDAMQEHLHSH